ncbi:MAG: DUF4350 domain-containing protein [Gammaproteobacteria bacterium]|nr:DUF4350 domain-containing protein [Gammaproteobacteria bacterium]
MRFLTWPRVMAGMLLVACTVMLYLIEWVEVGQGTMYSDEARRNPYLAAAKFAERLGVTVHRVDGLKLLDELPSNDDVILFASSRRALSERRLDSLMDWVAEGGNLILLATGFWDDELGAVADPVLGRIGIAMHPVSDEAEAAEDRLQVELTEIAIEAIDHDVLCGPAQSLVAMNFEDNDDGQLIAALTSDRYLKYQGDASVGWAANGSGYQLVQVSVGDGWVTALTSLRLWRNRIIRCNDHAHILRLLVGEGRSMWWLFNTEMPPLWELVWENHRTMVMALGLMLVLWVWHQTFRAAPATALEKTQRRAVLEHVTGVARFLWQQRRGDALLAALRQEVIAGRRGAALKRWVDEVARLSEYDAETIMAALQEPVGTDSDRFVRAVRILQGLRKMI